MTRRCRGFTLIEVVIAAVLFSLIMLGLLTAMRGMADAAERSTAAIERIDNMRLISEALRNLISNAENIVIADIDVGHLPPLAGNAMEMLWFAPMPAYHSTGGLHLFHLAVQDFAGESTLVLQFIPYTEPPPQPDWSATEPYALLPGVEKVEIAYQGYLQDEWQESWEEPQLPARIRLQLAARGRFWPELVIPVYGGGA